MMGRTELVAHHQFEAFVCPGEVGKTLLTFSSFRYFCKAALQRFGNLFDYGCIFRRHRCGQGRSTCRDNISTLRRGRLQRIFDDFSKIDLFQIAGDLRGHSPRCVALRRCSLR